MDEPACPGCRELLQRVAELEAQVAELPRRLDEAVRAGKRQAAAFRKGSPNPNPKTPGRKSLIRKFRVHVGHCEACGKRAQGRHPLQTSDALGAATGVFYVDGKDVAKLRESAGLMEKLRLWLHRQTGL